MSMLIEKRDELVAKKEALLAERDAAIEVDVDIYRNQLKANRPMPQEILSLDKAIDALNEVIAFEEANKSQEPEHIEACPAPEIIEAEKIEVEEVPEEKVPENAEIVEKVIVADNVEIVPTIEVLGQEAEGRPGMPIIIGPERG